MLTNLQIANGCICDCNQIALHKIMSEFIDGEPCNNNHEETLQRLSAITIVLETFSPCNAWTNLRNVCASRRCVKTLLTTLCAENRYISYESELASVAALTSSIMGKEEMRYFLHQVILKLVQQTQGNFQQIILLDVLSHSLSTCYFEYSETRCLPQTCPTARQHPVSHKESLTKSDILQEILLVLDQHWHKLVEVFASRSASELQNENLTLAWLSLWIRVLEAQRKLAVEECGKDGKHTCSEYLSSHPSVAVNMLKRSISRLVWTRMLELMLLSLALDMYDCHQLAIEIFQFFHDGTDHMPDTTVVAGFVGPNLSTGRACKVVDLTRTVKDCTSVHKDARKRKHCNWDGLSGGDSAAVVAIKTPKTRPIGVSTIMRKFVLLIVKSAVLVLQTNREVALMKTSSSMFKMVIALLSRHRLVVRPNSCSWVQQLYGDQDDELIDMMMELLKLYTFMAPAHSEVTDAMSPHIIFSQFLEMISFDHQVLLDLLISNETNFLEYLTRYLRLVSNDRESFFGHLSAVNGYRRCCPGLSVLNAWRGMRLPASTAPSPAEREALCNQASGHFSCAATCHDESSEHGETPLLVRLCAYSDSDGSDVEADVDSATSLLQETHSQTKNLLLNTHTVISNDSEDVGPNIGFYPAKTIAGNAACTTECNDHVIHQYCSTLASKKMDEREKNYAKKGMQKEQTHAEMSDSSHACLRDTACQGVEQHVVNTLKKLLISVERLQKRGLFPYHAGPLCRRLANVCK
ncbi:PREDICTED: uncharacterized protein LOC106808390 isoform X2 [Priapulus caudatus]|uniref:Uncharacterized protein LOC106808390 isoform X2 n=1 Tax=Priapulus caudatus TaxID=37621 RepID=A0ABM1E308_PRICU|nr:PREDICTED: uncharacterized protein LOC106808390 isoform X2 [Priapulus caudatus]